MGSNATGNADWRRSGADGLLAVPIFAGAAYCLWEAASATVVIGLLSLGRHAVRDTVLFGLAGLLGVVLGLTLWLHRRTAYYALICTGLLGFVFVGIRGFYTGLDMVFWYVVCPSYFAVLYGMHRLQVTKGAAEGEASGSILIDDIAFDNRPLGDKQAK